MADHGCSGDSQTSTQQKQTVAMVTRGVLKRSNVIRPNHLQPRSDGNGKGKVVGPIHNLVLQAFMKSMCLDLAGMRELFRGCFERLKCTVPVEELTTPSYILSVVQEINDRIYQNDPTILIEGLSCEITGKRFYALMHTDLQQIFRTERYFTMRDIGLFTKIFESIFQTRSTFIITMNDCVQVGAALGPGLYSIMETTSLVNKMVDLRYFVKISLDNEKEYGITIGFRSIREFETFFRKHYMNYFGTCSLCNMMLLHGIQCRTCPALYHKGCLKSHRMKSKICAACKCLWEDKDTLLIRSKCGSNGDIITDKVDDAEDSSLPQNASVAMEAEVEIPISQPTTARRREYSPDICDFKPSKPSRDQIISQNSSKAIEIKNIMSQQTVTGRKEYSPDICDFKSTKPSRDPKISQNSSKAVEIKKIMSQETVTQRKKYSPDICDFKPGPSSLDKSCASRKRKLSPDICSFRNKQ